MRIDYAAWLLIFAAASCPGSLLAVVDCPSVLSHPDALAELKAGGLLIFIRHEEDEIVGAEEARSGCEEPQRILTDRGKRRARALGETIDELQVPVAEVLSSPACRAVDSAKLVFPRFEVQPTPQLKIPGNQGWLSELLLLSRRQANGNIVLITHGAVISNIRIHGEQVVAGYSGGNSYAAIFAPDPNRPSLVGCLRWADWRKLVSSRTAQSPERAPGRGLFVGGVKLPLALAELDLIDEYELVVHSRLAGHGPTLFAGLSKLIDLKLVDRLELGSGAVALRYVPRR